MTAKPTRHQPEIHYRALVTGPDKVHHLRMIPGYRLQRVRDKYQAEEGTTFEVLCQDAGLEAAPRSLKKQMITGGHIGTPCRSKKRKNAPENVK